MSKKWADDFSSDEESVDDNDKDLVSDDEELVMPPVQQLPKKPIENSSINNVAPNTDDNSFIAHVSDINFSVDRMVLGRFFETAGCLLTNVQIIEKGTALVRFGNKGSLDICLKMDNTPLQGKNIRTTLFNHESGKPRPDGGHRGKGPSDVREKGGFRSGSGNRDVGRGRGKVLGDADRNKGPPAVANVKRVQSSGPLSEAQPVAPLTRPKLNLQPRSLPVESIGVPVTKATIFGEGRPQDEQAYEEQRRKEKLSAPNALSECPEPSVAENKPNVFEFAQTQAALHEAERIETEPAADRHVDTEKPAVAELSTPVAAVETNVDKRKKGTTPKATAGGPGQKSFQNRNSANSRSDRPGDQRPGPAGGRGGGRGAKAPIPAAAGDEVQQATKAAAGGSFRGGVAGHEKGTKSASSKFAPNNKLFQDAVHQTASATVDGRKDRQKGAPSPAASELTNEEKFNRAQQSFQAKGAVHVQGASAAVKRTTKSGGFAALQSDEESDA